MIRVTLALATLFVLLALGGAGPQILRGVAIAALAAVTIEVTGGLIALILRRRAPRAPVTPRRVGPRGTARPPTIVVDGSNVMHWNGDPSVLVLTRVVAALVARGERPHVYFDANVGYKLQDRFMDATAMAALLNLPPVRVTVADSGNPADPLLLDYATRLGARVLSNDRFRDWVLDYPQIGVRGFLVRGRWQQGSVILDLPQLPAKAA